MMTFDYHCLTIEVKVILCPLTNCLSYFDSFKLSGLFDDDPSLTFNPFLRRWAIQGLMALLFRKSMELFWVSQCFELYGNCISLNS